MKILITGGAGFIGSNLVKKALQAGHTILNLDKLTYAGSLQNLSKLPNSQNYQFQRVDICNKKQIAANILLLYGIKHYEQAFTK